MNSLRLSTLSLITMMVISIGAYAHCPGHKHCGPGGVDLDDALYDVAIKEDVLGTSQDPWSGGGGKFTLSSALRPNSGLLTDLSFFSTVPLIEDPPAFTVDEGMICFPQLHNESYHLRLHAPFPLYAGIIKPGKKGRAEVSLWFEANTYEPLPAESETTTLLYQLHLTGKFVGPWPPEVGSTDLVMDHWKLGATNEGADIKAISCIGEGTANVMITVTEQL